MTDASLNKVMTVVRKLEEHMYSMDSRCNDPSNPSVNLQYEDRSIIYKILVNNEDHCVIIVGRWDILLNIVWKPHISHNTIIKDPTRSHHLIIRRQS